VQIKIGDKISQYHGSKVSKKKRGNTKTQKIVSNKELWFPDKEFRSYEKGSSSVIFNTRLARYFMFTAFH
jgi:hypothetical protein